MKRAVLSLLAAASLMVPMLAEAQTQPQALAPAAAPAPTSPPAADAKKAADLATVTAKLKTGETECNPVNYVDYGAAQEVYCDVGLGYLLLSNPADPAKPVVFTCAELGGRSEIDAVTKKEALTAACRLPENREPLAIIDKIIKDTNTACAPIARSFIGETPTGGSIFFEAACDDGKGYLIQAWKSDRDVRTYKNSAWACNPVTFIARGNDCVLTKSGADAAKAAEARRVRLLSEYFAPPKAAAPAPAAAAPAPQPAGQ